MSASSEFGHISIMLPEVIEGLNIKPDGIYVDGTLGGGGHSYEIAKRLASGNLEGTDKGTNASGSLEGTDKDTSKAGRLIGIDRDADAIEAATERLAPFADRVTIVRDNYANAINVLQNLEIEKVDGVLLDLGVSSHQLDDADRGFSYKADAPLDMRMDQSESLTAEDIVNDYSESDLYHIIRDYGEDNFAKNIAKHIVAARNQQRIKTTGELAEIICRAIPMKVRKNGGHPAKRTFQAIRIELNQELTAINNVLLSLLESLNPGGRIAVITFHSLEDRIVKNVFKKAENPCTCPPNFPVCTCGAVSLGKVITRKPIIPSEEEMQANPRSKSAKLRIFERA